MLSASLAFTCEERAHPLINVREGCHEGLQLIGHGDPAQVVKLVDVPDVGPPGAGEVVIEVEASPIEPTDQYIIEGVYGQLPALPHCQGVGRVISVGRGVKHLREGDSMLVPLLSNARVERVKADASSLRPLPKGDVDQMSARDESGNQRICW
jgi:NADPH:quinone reductase-like Zn-dependent oxidoreductase